MVGGAAKGSHKSPAGSTNKATPGHQRTEFPGHSRGGDGGHAEADDKVINTQRTALDKLNDDQIDSMRAGFEVKDDVLKCPLYFGKSKYPALKATQRAIMDQLSTAWPKGVEPTLLKKHGNQLFKVIPPASAASRRDVPTLQEVGQGQYVPKQFETHDKHHRIMCVPCMTFSHDKADWGSTDRPDTRKVENSKKFSAFYLFAKKSVSNFANGHCRSDEHLRCMSKFCNVTNADKEAKLAIVALSKGLAAKRGYKQDWLKVLTPRPGDPPLHYKVYCSVCSKDIGETAMTATQWKGDLEVHLEDPAHTNFVQSTLRFVMEGKEQEAEAEAEAEDEKEEPSEVQEDENMLVDDDVDVPTKRKRSGDSNEAKDAKKGKGKQNQLTAHGFFTMGKAAQGGGEQSSNT